MHARQGQAFPGVTPSFHLLNYQLSKQRIPVVCPLTSYRQRTSRTLPKWIAALAFAARVGNQAIYQFQDILFAMDIRQRIIVHALGKIDRVHHLDAVAASLKQAAALNEDAALRVVPVKIENRSVTYNFRGLEIICFHIITHQPLYLVL